MSEKVEGKAVDAKERKSGGASEAAAHLRGVYPASGGPLPTGGRSAAFDVLLKSAGREKALTSRAAREIARQVSENIRRDPALGEMFAGFEPNEDLTGFALRLDGSVTSLDALEALKRAFASVAAGGKAAGEAGREVAKFLHEILECPSSANLALPPAGQPYWRTVGAIVVGPLLVAFSRWLAGKCDALGVERLYFLARDGQVMMRVFTALYPERASRCRYLLASRRLCQNMECREDYAAYLRAEGLDADGVAVVDVGRNGTVPRALAAILGRESVTAFYLDQRVQVPSLYGFVRQGDAPKRNRRMLDLLDFLLISPEHLTLAVRRDGGRFVPETLPDTPEEITRREIATELQAGAEECALAMRPLLDRLPPPSPEAAVAALGRFRLLTPRDREAMANVTIPFGAMNEKRRYLVTPAWPWKQRLRHPFSFLAAWRKRFLR